VLDSGEKSFLCCNCGLCDRGEGELRLSASMAGAGALFCRIKREMIRKVTEIWRASFFVEKTILLEEGFCGRVFS
jgi:hypothetical protein